MNWGQYKQLWNLRASRQKEGLLLRGTSVAPQRLSDQVSGARTVIELYDLLYDLVSTPFREENNPHIVIQATQLRK